MIRNMTAFKEADYDLISNYAATRIDAEKNASVLNKNKPVNINQIYDMLQNMTGCSDAWIEIMKNLEIRIEHKNIIPVTTRINQLKKLIEQGEEIVLISDMYLSENVVREILISIDDVFREIPIYISCDCGSSKSSGALFVHVRKELDVDYRMWTHVGDNYLSDVCIPKMLGIQTEWVSVPTREFQTLSEEVGYRVGGPILYSYVQWIVDVSRKQGIHKLYFIARDGYVLKCIADLILEKMDIETSYLYISRESFKEDNREQTIAYIEQSVGFSEDIALVDLQGTGRSLEILSSWIGKSLNVFYYILSSTNIERQNRYRIYASASGDIIETLCRAPHGYTSGYEKVADIWQPVLVKDYAEDGYEEKIESYVNGVCGHVSEILSLQRKNGVRLNMRKYSLEKLRECTDNPDAKTAEWIGDIYHGGMNEKRLQYAPKLSVEEAIDFYSNQESYRGCNYMYSLHRLNANDYLQVKQHIKKNEKKQYKSYISPAYNPQHINLVIYGAGIYGKKVISKYGKTEQFQILGWTDANEKKIEENELPLIHFAQAKKLEFDYFVIAIRLEVDSVRRLLSEAGVDSTKIITADELDSIYAESLYAEACRE